MFIYKNREYIKKRVIFSLILITIAFFCLTSTALAANPVFTKNLGWNNTSPSAEVKVLQQFLKDEGLYFGPITGAFLSLTYKAVQNFQIREKISPVTGYFGTVSRAKANAIAATKGFTGVASSTVSNLQSRISALLVEIVALQRRIVEAGLNRSIGSNTQIASPGPTPVPTPLVTNPTPSTPLSQPTSILGLKGTSKYPLHTNIVATVFWVGEPKGNGSSEDNALSAWDDEWEENYGGYDDYQNRNGYYPRGFTPKENPFYLDLPYNDFNNNGVRKANALQVIPWANTKVWQSNESLMKNRWVRISHNNNVCYGQIEDAGPYEYDDHAYVFGTTDSRPKSKEANNAGMDVSPALRDCLKFNGQNNADNRVDWQFVDFADVPDGPWKEIITTSQTNWP